MRPASIGDYREAARRRLPHFLFEYFDGGSYAERTLRANIEDLQDISLRQRVLNEASRTQQMDLAWAVYQRLLAGRGGRA